MCSAIPWPELRSRRLRLRAPRPDDAPRIAELANDFDVVRMTSSMPFPIRTPKRCSPSRPRRG